MRQKRMAIGKRIRPVKTGPARRIGMACVGEEATKSYLRYTIVTIRIDHATMLRTYLSFSLTDASPVFASATITIHYSLP